MLFNYDLITTTRWRRMSSFNLLGYQPRFTAAGPMYSYLNIHHLLLQETSRIGCRGRKTQRVSCYLRSWMEDVREAELLLLRAETAEVGTCAFGSSEAKIPKTV